MEDYRYCTASIEDNYLGIGNNFFVISTKRRDSINLITVDGNKKKTVIRIRGSGSSTDEKDVTNDIVSRQINLSYDGDWWEGDCLDEKPFGFGYLYDSDNNKRYEGYMYDKVKSFYGYEYFVNGNILYKGNFYNDMKHGYGTLYSIDGDVIYEGYWLNGKSVENIEPFRIDGMISNLASLHSLVTEIIINDESNTSAKSFHIRGFKYLKRVVMGNCCFPRVESFIIDNCHELETITIGTKYLALNQHESEYSDGDHVIIDVQKNKGRTCFRSLIKSNPNSVSIIIEFPMYYNYLDTKKHTLNSVNTLSFSSYQLSFLLIRSSATKRIVFWRWDHELWQGNL